MNSFAELQPHEKRTIAVYTEYMQNGTSKQEIK